MPWYRFYADHGPGHQGQSEKFVYADESWDAEDLESEWEDWCQQNWLEDATGDVELVKELPEEERQEQIKGYRGRVRRAIKILTILKADKE